MGEKLAEIVKVFSENPMFTVEDKLFNFQKRPDSSLYLPKVDYDKLTEFYGLPKNDFREQVAVLVNPEELTAKKPNYRINWITSVDVRAANARKYFGDTEPFFQLAAGGITTTGDKQVLLGVRGGEITPERIQQYASGLWGLAPGGSVTFKPKYDTDPIIDTLRNEFREELGNFEITHCKPIGICNAYRPGPTGIKFFGEIRTDATLRQIQETNINGNKLWKNLKSKGAKKEEIEEEMKRMNLPIDAWEHNPLVGIPNDSDSIRAFLAQPQIFAGICVGPLELYLEYLRLQRQ